jgi:hypothetical protein
MTLVNRIRDYFKRSKRIHLRSNVETVSDAIRLIDRFLDGTMRYPLEWDDFISWENENPSVEVLRAKIADLEPGFMSRDAGGKQEAINETVRLRNQYAALVGIPIRGG